MTPTCHECGTTEELRPYGPGGAPICFDCATSTPEREEAASQVFLAQMDAAAAMSPQNGVVLTDDGPQPFHLPGARL